MTKDLMIEITKSSTGKAVLKVNNFKFCHERTGQEGLHLWTCVRSTCTAKFYTDDSFNMVHNDTNSLLHNHVLSRTKLVKRLVIKEIRKVVALKGESIPTGELKKYALDYLNQAFASTLKHNEMNSVKKAIHSYCRYYRTPTDISSVLSSPSSPQNKIRPITQNPNELRRLKICKAVEQQAMQYEDDIDETGVTSSSESESEPVDNNDAEEQQAEEDLEYTETEEAKYSTEPMFASGGEQTLFNQQDTKPYPNMTIVQPIGAVYTAVSDAIKADFPDPLYTVARAPGWQPVTLTMKEGVVPENDNQPGFQAGFDPLHVDFAYQTPLMAQGVDVRFTPPGSAFSFVGAVAPTIFIPRVEPMKPITQNVIDLSGENFNQRSFPEREQEDPEDEDQKFCMSLVPMFRRLSVSDKAMIKAQIHQLMTWKLKTTM